MVTVITTAIAKLTEYANTQTTMFHLLFSTLELGITHVLSLTKY